MASTLGGSILGIQVASTVIGAMMTFYTGIATTVIAIVDTVSGKDSKFKDDLIILIRIALGLCLMILPWVLL